MALNFKNFAEQRQQYIAMVDYIFDSMELVTNLYSNETGQTVVEGDMEAAFCELHDGKVSEWTKLLNEMHIFRANIFRMLATANNQYLVLSTSPTFVKNVKEKGGKKL